MSAALVPSDPGDSDAWRRRGAAPGVVSLGTKASMDTWAVPDGDLAAQARAAMQQWSGTELQDIVDLLRRSLGVDVAAISVLDDDAFHYLVCAGLGPFANPRDQALCDLAIDVDDFVEIPDLSADERTRNYAVVDGRRMSLRYFGSCPLVVDGRPVGRVCLFDDRPRELDEAGRRLLSVMARAASTALDAELQRTRARSESSPAHAQQLARADLRASVTTLHATLDVLRSVLQLEPGSLATSLVDKAVASSQSVGNAVSRIMDPSEGDAGSEVDVDLDSVMSEVEADLTGLIARTGGSLRWEQMGWVVGSHAALYSVLLNLVSHGLAASRLDGRPAVTVFGEETPDGFTVRVRDAGGVRRAQDRRRVMELFNELNDGGAGTSGLATVARMVEQHGGIIGVEDAPGGRGTEVWFTVPQR